MKHKDHAVLEKKLLQEVERLCRSIDNPALGFSGGMDSVVLAEALLRLGRKPYCLHVNHRWRGEESEADERWVREWCRERKLKLAVRRPGRGIPRTEGAARTERMDFFRKTAEKHGIGAVFLAHHGDDHVETFFLQLLRGAGPEGLAGLHERRVIGGLTFLRPLLGFTKEELRCLARAWKLEWREDASNASPEYFRNRVRHRLLPYLKKLGGRDMSPLIARTARVLADENAYWDSILPESWPEKLPLKLLRGKAVAWQRRAVRAWLAGCGVTDAGFEQIEQVRLMLEQEKPSKINLSRDRCCRRRGGVLFVE